MCYSGENLNISWSPKGETIAVGNKDDLISFIDCKNYKIRLEKQFKEIDSKFPPIPSNAFLVSDMIYTVSVIRYDSSWTRVSVDGSLTGRK